MKRALALVGPFALLLSLLGFASCASRPDIVGNNDDAEEWAEKQQREREQTKPGDPPKGWPEPQTPPAPPPPPAAKQPPAAQPAQPSPQTSSPGAAN